MQQIGKYQGLRPSDYHLNLTKKLYFYMTPFVSMNPREAYFNYKDLDLGINNNGKASYFEGRAYGIRNEQSIPTLP
ncbi:hypothetical protein L3X38_003025 [Prunus dulcis]|uniref:Uncharacterized protein n=1 Tax=Prunus dulcis TaxID=3755 RepID=A0AAD4WYA7_PRUDU|nr:hypothetical protein L3X38_003025 [Prunus dulcis]